MQYRNMQEQKLAKSDNFGGELGPKGPDTESHWDEKPPYLSGRTEMAAPHSQDAASLV
ncbi:hypothetical protein ACFORG_16060 [Lutimaribacter marinistellae]|uniref:Uncharacterized protein n=1 Tax=Lutimaribacter marinistellae TaxID=1820329 RepID=A0ABV7TM81_9RHOB